MLYCFEKKGTGALSNDLMRKKLVQYCSQEKGTGALLFSGEGNRCSTAFRRRKQVHYCYQKKKTGALLFSGEGIWCSTVLRRRKLMRYCPQGEGNWCSTAHVLIRRRVRVLYCFREKGDGAVLYSGERKWYCIKFTG